MTLLEWALTYARRGWPVFPCNPKTKRPLPKGDVDAAGIEIPNTGGVKKATINEAAIIAWWTAHPKAMIGLATGKVAGVFVVDIDAGADEKSGEVFETEDLLTALNKELGVKLPKTWAVTTPRGGRHLYFQFPQDDVIGNRTGIIKRVDIRGEGGYVILPPSARPDGKYYAWADRPKIKDERPARPPAALIDCILRVGKWQEQSAPAPRTISQRAAVKAPALREGDPLLADVDTAVADYAQAALKAECAALAGAGRGDRNGRLNLAALRLSELVAAGVLDEGAVRAALEAAAMACGIWKEDGARACRATIASGFRKGLRSPRDLTEIRAKAAARLARAGRANDSGRASGRSASGLPSAAAPPPSSAEDYGTLPAGESSQTGAADKPAAGGKGRDQKPPGGKAAGGRSAKRAPPRARDRGFDDVPDDDADLDLQLAFYPLTDLGNAERFAARQRDLLRWCSALGWLWWDDRRWNRAGSEERVKIAEHNTVRGLQLEADALRASGKDKIVGTKGRGDKEEAVYHSDLLEAWGRASEAANRLSPISKRAAPYLAIEPHQLDADPFKLNVANGTLHITRGADGDAVTLHPHNPNDLITKIADVVYDPAALRPVFDDFLAFVQPIDDNRRFLAAWHGYSLIGDTSEQMLVFNWGKGKNGKSTLLDALAQVAGDYGKTMPIETFINEGRGRNAGQATPDLAMLQGVRFLRASEPERGAKLAESLIKLATGGEEMPVRELNRPYFMLRPSFKLTMSGNYRPVIQGADEGIWRRMHLLPWIVTVSLERRDKALPDKLKRELSGILNWMLDGLRDWLDNGMRAPAAVVEATKEYRSDSDPLARFLAACVTEEIGGKGVQSSVLHELFLAWAAANGASKWTPKGFSMAMQEKGHRIKHSNVNWWVNLKATKTVNDFVDQEGKPLRVTGGEAPAESDRTDSRAQRAGRWNEDDDDEIPV